MTFPEQSPDPSIRLAALIAQLRQQVAQLQRRGSIIPVLDEDPEDDDPTNLWLLNDGRLRSRTADGTIHEYTPAVSPGGSTSTVPKPPAVSMFQHQTTWESDEASCYCPVHGVEGLMYYGQLDTTHGERRLMYGFDDAAIRTALLDSVVRKVELRATNLHAYRDDGVSIRWGGHSAGSLGSAFSQNYPGVWSGNWPSVGGGTWRTIPNWFGTALKDDLIRGLTVDQPTTSPSYYGQLSQGISLRITYTNTTP